MNATDFQFPTMTQFEEMKNYLLQIINEQNEQINKNRTMINKLVNKTICCCPPMLRCQVHEGIKKSYSEYQNGIDECMKKAHQKRMDDIKSTGRNLAQHISNEEMDEALKEERHRARMARKFERENAKKEIIPEPEVFEEKYPDINQDEGFDMEPQSDGEEEFLNIINELEQDLPEEEKTLPINEELPITSPSVQEYVLSEYPRVEASNPTTLLDVLRNTPIEEEKVEVVEDEEKREENIYTREILKKKSVAEMKKICKTLGLHGYSVYTKKEQLICVILGEPIKHEEKRVLEGKDAEELLKMSLPALKEICKNRKYKGFSKSAKKKEDLIAFMLDQLNK